MLLSIAVGALTWYPVSASLALANEAGADGAELLVTPEMLRRGPDDFAGAAEHCNIPILSVHSMLRLRPTSYERKLADDEASIGFAAALPTCRMVVLHPPLTGPRGTAQLHRWFDAVCAARQRSGNPALALTLENRGDYHDGTEPQFLDDLVRLRHVAGEWGLGITLDIAHAASFQLDLCEAVGQVMPLLRNVHLSDALDRAYRGGVRNGLFRDHQVPTRGTLPLDSVLATLALGGYSGLLTLELSPVSLRIWWPWKTRSLLKCAVQDTRAMLGAVAAVAHEREQPRHPAV